MFKFQPLEIRQVRGTPFEKMFNSLIAQYHYLGYCHPVGEHLKYIIFSKSRPIACFAWSSAPRHIGCRDRFIGWSPEVRKKNLYLIAYNTRFIIFHWIRVPYLASHLLSRMAKVLPIDWQKIYNHPIYFLETFVDTEKLHYLLSCSRMDSIRLHERVSPKWRALLLSWADKRDICTPLMQDSEASSISALSFTTTTESGANNGS